MAANTAEYEYQLDGELNETTHSRRLNVLEIARCTNVYHIKNINT